MDINITIKHIDSSKYNNIHMELNQDTIKKGMSLYLLNIYRVKKPYYWFFEFNKVKILSLNQPPTYSNYIIRYKKTLTNQNFGNYSTMDFILTKHMLHNNKKPYVKIKDNDIDNIKDIIFLCDSFETLTQVLKQIFNPKANEITKRKREKVFRELIRRWTKSPYRNNFSTKIT